MSSTTPTATAFAAGLGAAAIDDTVTARFQSFLSLTTNSPIAVSQSDFQSCDNFVGAAALPTLSDLVADFVSGFGANFFVGVVEAVDQGIHNFGIADAIELVAQLIESATALTGIASRLRLVNQLSDFTRISTTLLLATRLGAALGLWAAFRLRAALGLAATGTDQVHGNRLNTRQRRGDTGSFIARR